MSKNQINTRLIRTKTELARARAANLQGVKSTDGVIMGSGEINRDGVPRLPPDQRQVKNWPVLDMGIHPEISENEWRLQVGGLVANPMTLKYADLLALNPVEDTSDFHCVTGWSQFDIQWRGVRFSDLAHCAQVLPTAKYVFITASDGYTTNLPLEEALKPDVLLAFAANGQRLAREHGGPVRMITPQLWAWKGAKWISQIEFLATDRRGFWEERGYSNSAIPWLNDRYSTDEQPTE